MDRNSPSTATQADSGGNSRLGRRTFVKGLGVSAAGAGALGLEGGPVQQSAAVDLPSRDTVITAAGIAVSPPLWAAKQVYDRVTDTATGDDVNDQLGDLNADETHTSVYQDGIEMASVDDRVLTSIENVISGLDRTSYQKGIEKAISEMNLGSTESEVKTAAKDAAREVISTTQKNLLDHYSVQSTKIARLAGELASTSNIDTSVMPVIEDDGTNYSSASGPYYASENTGTVTYSLSNSTQYTIDTGMIADGSGNTKTNQLDYSGNTYDIAVEPPSTGSRVIAFNNRRFSESGIWGTLLDIDSTVMSELDSWVTGIYPSYAAGDVELSEIVTSDQLAATASEQNDLSNVTADFARLGIPINDRTTLTIEIVSGDNSGTIIDGNLSVQSPPTDGFIVGDTYDPSNFAGPVYLMYDRTTESGETEGDVLQVSGKFKVIDAKGYDGEPVSNVTFAEKSQERYSTDVTALKDELDKLSQQQQDIQDERDALIEEEATGGGGGFLADVGTNYGLLAAGGAVIAYLVLGDN